ncbi:hypothetical protein KP509_1Z112100 [Ceratopteris richardii]|nr:hypothetical protein KP509_1Z112100 [Ceratopteris richardii]
MVIDISDGTPSMVVDRSHGTPSTIKWALRREICFISQHKYLFSILDSFEMSHCKQVSTNMEYTLKLTKDFLVNYLSQYQEAPKVFHWNATKRILRCLKGTSSFGIIFKGDILNLHGFSDSNYGVNLADRNSISGNSIFLGNEAISWSSRKQKVDILIREKIQSGDIILQHSNMKENVANLFTKSLSRKFFVKHKSLLGMMEHVNFGRLDFKLRASSQNGFFSKVVPCRISI